MLQLNKTWSTQRFRGCYWKLAIRPEGKTQDELDKRNAVLILSSSKKQNCWSRKQFELDKEVLDKRFKDAEENNVKTTR